MENIVESIEDEDEFSDKKSEPDAEEKIQKINNNGPTQNEIVESVGHSDAKLEILSDRNSPIN